MPAVQLNVVLGVYYDSKFQLCSELRYEEQVIILLFSVFDLTFHIQRGKNTS